MVRAPPQHAERDQPHRMPSWPRSRGLGSWGRGPDARSVHGRHRTDAAEGRAASRGRARGSRPQPAKSPTQTSDVDGPTTSGGVLHRAGPFDDFRVTPGRSSADRWTVRRVALLAQLLPDRDRAARSRPLPGCGGAARAAASPVREAIPSHSSRNRPHADGAGGRRTSDADFDLGVPVLHPARLRPRYQHSCDSPRVTSPATAPGRSRPARAQEDQVPRRAAPLTDRRAPQSRLRPSPVARQPVQPVSDPHRSRTARVARPSDLRAQGGDLPAGTGTEPQRATSGERPACSRSTAGVITPVS
jgi:hypothetical protein